MTVRLRKSLIVIFVRILEILCRNLQLNESIDMDKIVLNTPGYVGADLNALIDEALISSLDRRLMHQICEDQKDFLVNCTKYLDYIEP